jgi:DNA-binding response OmpR family regulator
MNARQILLLEDDRNLGFIVKEHLTMNGFGVTLCANGAEGLAAMGQDHFDLALVDIMMPTMDGFTFARSVRATDTSMPIIFLTAKAMKEDRIEGFTIGCDDYVTKPFSMEELLLRIQAVLRRALPPGENPSDRFAIGHYMFDYTKQTLQRNTHVQNLTTKESELLRLLCLNMNRTLERDAALRTVWHDESYFTGRSMDVFVSRLRKYLQDDPDVEIINVHGRGFKLITPKVS